MTDASPGRSSWNVRMALPSVDGCEEDLRGLLEIWLRQAPRLLSEIQAAVECGDSAQLLLSAHTLKGSLQILCADDAAETATQLEVCGQKNLASDAPALLPRLRTEIAILTELVHTYLSEAL